MFPLELLMFKVLAVKKIIYPTGKEHTRKLPTTCH
jgi:hypothetical protein